MNAKDNLHGTPVSVKIRERIAASRKRFHSNDNIAEFIETYEISQSKKKAEKKLAKKPKGIEAFLEGPSELEINLLENEFVTIEE